MHDAEDRLAGGRLFYRRWPAPDPKGDVVIAHGYAEHSGRYHHVATALRQAGFSCWAIDHRGHGRSEGERGDIGSIDATVADLDLLVDLVTTEGNGGPIVLVGHSMGTVVSTAYALAHQDRLTGLALSAPVMVVPPEIIALGEMDVIPELGLADAVSREAGVVEAYKTDPLVHLGPPPRGFLLAMRDVDGIRRRLSELTLPVLVMHGSADLLASPQGLREVVAGVSSEDLTARLWPGLFHEIFNEPEKDLVLELLVAWVERLAC